LPTCAHSLGSLDGWADVVELSVWWCTAECNWTPLL